MSEFFYALIPRLQKTEQKKKLNIRKDDLVIINIGRFSFSKAQRYTIQSFAELKKEFPNLDFIKSATLLP